MQKISKIQIFITCLLSTIVNYLFICSYSEIQEFEFFAAVSVVLGILVYTCVYYTLKAAPQFNFKFSNSKSVSYMVFILIISVLFSFSSLLNPIMWLLFSSMGVLNEKMLISYGFLYGFGLLFLPLSLYYLIYINKKEKLFYLFVAALLMSYTFIGVKQQIKLNNIKNECNLNTQMNDKLKNRCFLYSSLFSIQEKYDFDYRILKHVKENKLMYKQNYAIEFLRKYRDCAASLEKCDTKDGKELLLDNLLYCTSLGDPYCASELLIAQDNLNEKIDKKLFMQHFSKYQYCKNKILYEYGEYRFLKEICGSKNVTH